MTGWRPISEAPREEPILFWVPPTPHGCIKGARALGYVYDNFEGKPVAKAKGFVGNWAITLWHALPDPPRSA